VQQGDPLSTLLFVVVMEAFSRMMTVTVERGLMSGFFVDSKNQEAMVVSHLLFANDTLIFCEPNVEQLRNLRCLVLCFKVVSGLKINLSKSDIVPVGEVDDVEGLSRILGCGLVSLPIKYLDLPLGAQYKASNIWCNIIEKTEIKLARWKRLNLSREAS
jgi:hypothetical protein